MFGLPKSTEIKKPIPKTLLYQKFPAELSGEKKTKFNADIGRMLIANEISEASVNIKGTESIAAIFVVQIELKNREYNERNIILISKLFKQHLLLVLHHEDKYKLAIYETQLLTSAWKSEEELSLKLNGLDMTAVWESLVTQVSGIKAQEGNTLDEQITKESEKEKLRKQIDDLERKARKESQSKRKFEMFQQIKTLEKKLEAL